MAEPLTPTFNQSPLPDHPPTRRLVLHLRTQRLTHNGRRHDPAIIDGAIADGADIAYYGDAQGNNFLHLALFHKCPYLVSHIIGKHMADPPRHRHLFLQKNREGDYPLVAAVKAGNLYAVKKICAHVNSHVINHKNGAGDTVLHMLAYQTHARRLAMFDVLLTAGADHTIDCIGIISRAPHIAARYGDVELIDHLVARGIDPHEYNHTGMDAAFVANIDALKALTRHGVDLKALRVVPPNRTPMSLMDYAVHFDDAEKVAFLLSQGVQPDEKPPFPANIRPFAYTATDGETPLERACKTGKTKCRALMEQHLIDRRNNIATPQLPVPRAQPIRVSRKNPGGMS